MRARQAGARGHRPSAGCRASRGRRIWALGAAAILGLLFACRPLFNPRLSPELAGWAEGPIRWLLLPREVREFQGLKTDRQAMAFIQEFWRRRDPDPGSPGNAFVQLFSERVEAADRLYGEGERRGSLTDRGRALILLGPPSELSVTQKTGLEWDAARRGRPRAAARPIRVESWRYPPAEIAPWLREALPEAAQRRGITVTFVTEGERTRLAEGEGLLELAARAAVRRPGA